ncbi:MAG: 50S ribosomal protein L21 [Chloroflexi bacterium]|nr:50S ribosomal protein L21 [Chloroflexota bacterium]
MQNYAIIQTGGKQYRVSPGDVVDVDKLTAEVGSTVELNDVLFVSNDDKVTIGTPKVEGAKVIATVEWEGRGEKITVFRYKSKVRQRRKTGHRQPYTRLTIKEIVLKGERSSRGRRAKAEVKENGS